MSRIGKRILTIPNSVTINVEGNTIVVKGPKGELTNKIPKNIIVRQVDNTIVVERKNDTKEAKQLHGTINAIIKNMLIGVTEGFKKELETMGVGYRFQLQDNSLVVNAGYSHPVKIDIPNGIKVDLISNTEIVVTGIDKVQLGEFAANIRKVREPEPYKGKGIRYKGEYVHRKEGKKVI